MSPSFVGQIAGENPIWSSSPSPLFSSQKPWSPTNKTLRKKNTEISGLFLSAQHLNIRKIIRLCIYAQKIKRCQVKIIIFVPKKSSDVKWKPSKKSLKKLCQGTSRGSPAAMADLPLLPWPPRLEATAPQWAPPALPSIAWPPTAKLPPPGVDFWISGFLEFWISGCNPKSSWTPKQWWFCDKKKNGTKWFNRTMKMGLIVSYWCDSCL